MKRLCIIVPVYNDWWRVELNLESFKRIVTDFESEVDLIFVDNGSEYIPDLDPDLFDVLSCEKPGSYSARNYAIKNILDEYDAFVFTDADCIPHQDWIPRILKRAELGFDLLAGDVKVFCENGTESYVESYDLIFGLPQRRYVENGYAVTANLTISSRVFLEIGLFDDSRFSGGDAEICRRAKERGFRLDFDPDALVYHPARTNWSEIVKKVRRVTGGQTGNGRLSRRLMFLVLNMLPPIRAYKILLLTKKEFSGTSKLKAFFVLNCLWPVRAYQSIKSIFFGPNVR